MSTLELGAYQLNMPVTADGGISPPVEVLLSGETTWQYRNDSNERVTFTGTGFTYNADRFLTGGTATQVEVRNHADGATFFTLVFSTPVAAADLPINVATSVSAAWQRSVFSGSDTLTGGNQPEYLVAGAGNDSVYGGPGDDTLDGDEAGQTGGGPDTVQGAAGNDTVRGLDGDDLIYGDLPDGNGADDLNGNQGQDTVYGGQGADLVRGGQGNDVVYGDNGDDIHVNGNLGNDTVYGGGGNDLMFGGQNDDLLIGDLGLDSLSGDLGNDTLTGGSSQDWFYFNANAGSDVVTDFQIGTNGSAQDRIVLPRSTTYTLSQVDGNAVLTLSTGGTVTLVGVASADLPASLILNQ